MAIICHFAGGWGPGGMHVTVACPPVSNLRNPYRPGPARKLRLPGPDWKYRNPWAAVAEADAFIPMYGPAWGRKRMLRKGKHFARYQVNSKLKCGPARRYVMHCLPAKEGEK